MSDEFDVVGLLIVIVLAAFMFLIGTSFGANVVHDKWKQDAIERCVKTGATHEWCRGRAELEKW